MIFLIFNFNFNTIYGYALLVIVRNGNKSVKTIQEYDSSVKKFKRHELYNTKSKVGNKILFS